MIPMKYLPKIGVFEVDFQGAKVKASLVKDETVLDAKITELRSSLQCQRCPVVGIYFKMHTDKIAELMILCSMNHCLIMKPAKLLSPPCSLKNFLEDKDICFVGNGIRDQIQSLTLVNDQVWPVVGFRNIISISLSGVVEVCDLASMVLKKSNFNKCGLAELEKEVRNKNIVASTTASSSSCLPPPVEKANLAEIKCPDWSSVWLSDAEIKLVIHDACTGSIIGDFLLGND